MTKFLINDCHTNNIGKRRIVFNRQINSVVNHQSKSANRKWIAIALVTFLVISIGLFALITDQFSLPEIVPPNSSDDSSTYNHEELVNYALVLINNDRQKNGLTNVTLSAIDSAQLHAKNMLDNDYFSHWDLKGYKPYMRYTLAGGLGSVSENCAVTYSNSSIDPIVSLKDIQLGMMYDDAESDWGHRDNILNPLHNKVSIGIAYNNNEIYLVQDFEDDYLLWNVLNEESNEVVMNGETLLEETLEQIGIFYDNPRSLNSQELQEPPYDKGYDSGIYVGSVNPPLPSGWEYEEPDEGILIVAKKWIITEQNFEINFDLTPATQKYGKGVYTLYLWTESNNYLTTYSIWYNG